MRGPSQFHTEHYAPLSSGVLSKHFESKMTCPGGALQPASASEMPTRHFATERRLDVGLARECIPEPKHHAHRKCSMNGANHDLGTSPANRRTLSSARFIHIQVPS